MVVSLYDVLLVFRSINLQKGDCVILQFMSALLAQRTIHSKIEDLPKIRGGAYRVHPLPPESATEYGRNGVMV